MFILRGAPLSPDVAFLDDNDIQRPAGWLRRCTIEERTAAGVSEQPDPPAPPDQRFAWGYADDGSTIWKDHAQLVELWVGQVKQTAASLLQQTDWLVVRSQDLSSQKPVPDWALNERGLIRFKSDEKEAAIRATADSAELAAYVTSPAFSLWEDAPAPTPAPTPAPADTEDSLIFDGMSSDQGV
jgi:hypothetical protein